MIDNVMIMTDTKLQLLIHEAQREGDHPIAKLDDRGMPWMRVHVSYHKFDDSDINRGKPMRIVAWLPVLTPVHCPEPLRDYVFTILQVMQSAKIQSGS